MPGTREEKFANLRLLFGYMMAYPGKKLTFMGQEIAQLSEWDCNKEIDWWLLGTELNKQLQDYLKELNQLYLHKNSFWQIDNDWQGFQWLEPDDHQSSVTSFFRSNKEDQHIIVACNFSEIYYKGYRLGVPECGLYHVVLNSNQTRFGGDDYRNEIVIESQDRLAGFFF